MTPELNDRKKDSVVYFRELTKIPHPSRHVEKMRDYLIAFADEHHLQHRTDALGNLLITRNGPKNSPRIILQAHMDMVPETREGLDFDFTTNPIPLIEENGWFKTDGTTLGADDGSGVAIILTVLSSPKTMFSGLTLYGLFTVDEEISMIGARDISLDMLDADALINLDINIDSKLCIGSSGIVSANFETATPLIHADTNQNWYSLTVSGLQGGHSGGDIDKNRANAVKLAADYIKQFNSVVLVSFNGGAVDNAIAQDARVIFGTPSPISDNSVEIFCKKAKEIYSDPDLSLTLEKIKTPDTSMNPEISTKILTSIQSFQQGVLSRNKAGEVWTSENFGAVKCDGGKITFLISTRSRNNDEMTASMDSIRSHFISHGFKSVSEIRSNAWDEKEDTRLIQLATETYKELNGKPMMTAKAHGGLECSWFSYKNPKLQCISCGPTYTGMHTPSETISYDALRKEETYIHTLLKKIEINWK